MEVVSLLKGLNKQYKLVEIPLSQIRTNPNQPRKSFSSESIAELAESIRQHGLLQPITVRMGKFPRYELIAGERRLRACRLAGLKTINAIVMEATNYDRAALSLIENIQRENLSYMEEAEAFSSLIDEYCLTQEELAEKLGKNQATIANKLRLLRLSPTVKNILVKYNLTERHARALIRLQNEQMQLEALEIICDKCLNVQQTDSLIDKILCEKPAPSSSPSPEKKSIRIIKDIRIFTNTIKQAIELMKQSGIDASSEKIEFDEYIEYIVRIPKSS